MFEKKYLINGIFTFAFMIMTVLLSGLSVGAKEPDQATVYYKVHVQTYGDEKSYHKDGEMSGTSGQS